MACPRRDAREKLEGIGYPGRAVWVAAITRAIETLDSFLSYDTILAAGQLSFRVDRTGINPYATSYKLAVLR